MEKWLFRLYVLVVGFGFGRDDGFFRNVKVVCRVIVRDFFGGFDV